MPSVFIKVSRRSVIIIIIIIIMLHYNGYLLLVTSEHSHLLYLFLQSLVCNTTGNVVNVSTLFIRNTLWTPAMLPSP